MKFLKTHGGTFYMITITATPCPFFFVLSFSVNEMRTIRLLVTKLWIKPEPALSFPWHSLSSLGT